MLSIPLSAYRSVFLTSPLGDYILSLDFTIIDVNDAFLRITSLTRDDLIGKNLFVAFPDNPDDLEDTGVSALRKSLQRVIATGKPDTLALQRYPIPVASADGTVKFEERYWSAVSTPIFDDNEQLAYIWHSTIDVTDLQRIKDQMKNGQDQEIDEPGLARAEAAMFTRSQTLQKVNQALDAERSRLRHLFDQAPGFVYFTEGPEHVIQQANAALYALIGPREIIGKPIRAAFGEIEGQGFFELHDEVYRTGQPYVGHGKRALVRNDIDNRMSERYIDIVYQPIVDADGRVIGICGQGNDITEKKRIEDEMRISNERWSFVMEGSGDAFWDWNLQTDEFLVSRRWKEMLGFGEHEIRNRIREAEERTHPEDWPHVMEKITACLNGSTDSFSSEFRMCCKDGSWKWMLSRGKVVSRDNQGKALRMTGAMTDISEKKWSEEQIWRQANFDALTGLPNRRLFRDRLEHELRKSYRSGRPVALLFIDLDRFKEVNDLLGHDTGDGLLAQAAHRICKCVRASDTVARLGGDEFTAILTDLESHAHVEEIAGKIIGTLSDPFQMGTEIAYISGSIGITLYPIDAIDPEALIRNADQAMYCAKKSGRNRFQYFTRSMQEQAHARLRLGSDLRGALAAGQLHVFYQPVVEFPSRRVVKAEALLRWRHPRLGLVEPSQFISLAEESGMINDIGNWVFKQAVAYSQRWSGRLGEPFEISVNRSPIQFMSQSDDVDWTSYLEQHGLPGKSISVEITEGILFNASPSVAQTLLRYRDAGIQLAIDDFGTGYSSMAYLKKFDVDYLKIDRSFVRDIDSNDGSRTIAKSIIVMAHELGLKVIAEGIETATQADILLEDGCDYGQGYLFSEAVPPEAFERLLIGQIGKRRQKIPGKRRITPS